MRNARRGLLGVALAGLLLGLGSATAGPPEKTAGRPGLLFVDVSGADYIEVIDLGTRQSVGRIKVGKRPHGLALGQPDLYDPFAGVRQRADYLYVTVEDEGQLAVIDTATRKVVRRLKIGAAPNQLALTRDARFAYVPLRQEASVAVVEFEQQLSTVSIRKPDGSARDWPVSEYQARLVKKIPVGEEPHNAYTGATTGRIYVATVRGRKIHVLDPQSHEQRYTIDLPGEVRPLAITRDETRAFAAISGFHGVVVVDLAERKVLTQFELPPLPAGTPAPYLNTYVHGLALSPDEKELWVTSCADGVVYVYSTADFSLLGKVPVGKFPHWFAWQPAGPAGGPELLWVSEMESNTVSAIDPARRAVVATVPTGPAPRRIVVLPPRAP